MTCSECGRTKGWDCECPDNVCPCGNTFSDAEMDPEDPTLCPTCNELRRQAETKRVG